MNEYREDKVDGALICHLTSVHARHDTRIFLKECRSLADAGYLVHLIVADGKGDEINENVRIIDAGASSSRLQRIRHAPQRVLEKALLVDAQIYHLHDPELIPIGLALKKAGKRVIFDAHEDVPKQLLGKPYLNRPLRWLLSKVFAQYESWACRKLDGVVAATPFICKKFLSINPNTVNVGNFPMLGELTPPPKIAWSSRALQVAYIGGISKIRGVKELVQALPYTSSGARLKLGGKFSEPEFEKAVKSEAGWEHVDELGFVNREGVRTVLAESIAGLVTFYPTISHLDALPNKMFEYMSAGIPVIASNFPLWQEIIDGSQCGICVDPLDSRAVAQAIDYLVAHPEEAKSMGQNGQKSIQERYNWDMEARKLIAFYRRMMDS
ncbi:glycosyltransferase family 4 protein [Variovorax sp. ZS18.2.2]|uniref:glycosyltransferase family 4 protein n=1 Tax=Variovorax sp. ZS18.2.2 TaxID=2971255 RepID=UPI002151F6E5|nr:glycosyltransferase family 4 protein [Variovorax sp. ZS18.2.2]MCR6477498.1 glycosyltransferase family 4 protein [Variovorax sp. ZS18.2.2]